MEYFDLLTVPVYVVGTDCNGSFARGQKSVSAVCPRSVFISNLIVGLGFLKVLQQ